MAPPRSRSARADVLLRRMPHVPEAVKARLRTEFIETEQPRGQSVALEKFYAHLEAVGRTPDQVRSADFETLSASRTAHRILLQALRSYASDVPLAAARPVSQYWDHWLNSHYNVKPRKSCISTRVALLACDWPSSWLVAVPLLDQTIRINGQRFTALAPKTRDAVVQAVGMLGTARVWAQKRGVTLDDAFSPTLFECFTRFMLLERNVSSQTVADYLERIRILGQRGQIIGPESQLTLKELIGALRDDAAEDEPGKRAKVRAFRAQFTLTDLLNQSQKNTI